MAHGSLSTSETTTTRLHHPPTTATPLPQAVGTTSAFRYHGKWLATIRPSIPTRAIRVIPSLRSKIHGRPKPTIEATATQTPWATIAAHSRCLPTGTTSESWFTSMVPTALSPFISTVNTWVIHRAPTPMPSSISPTLLAKPTRTTSLWLVSVGATAATWRGRTCGTSRASIATCISWPRRRCSSPTTISTQASTAITPVAA